MLETINQLISIFSGLVMGIIGVYTAYLTIYCKTINIISLRKINYSSDKEHHIKFVVQIHNKGLSPICVSKLYLIFNRTHFIVLQEYEEPLILQAHTAVSIEGYDIWRPKFDFDNPEILNKPIYLLSITNKGISVSGYHYTNKIKAICFYIDILKWKYKQYYKKLIPIEYTSYINENCTIGALIKPVISDNSFVSVVVIGSSNSSSR